MRFATKLSGQIAVIFGYFEVIRYITAGCAGQAWPALRLGDDVRRMAVARRVALCTRRSSPRHGLFHTGSWLHIAPQLLTGQSTADPRVRRLSAGRLNRQKCDLAIGGI
jgi:hypothetical protein